MFAILKTGGKQYTVSAGDVIRIEKVEGEAGKIVEFSQLMMINDGKSTKVGTPLLSNSLIKATILEQTHNKTVIVFKKRRRQGYDRKNGHRQLVSIVHIDEIVADGKSLAKAEVPAAKSKVKAEVKKAVEKPKVEQKSIEKKAPVKKAHPEKPESPKPAPVKPVAHKEAEKKVAAKKSTAKPAAKTKVAKKSTPKKPAAKKPVTKKTKE